MSGRLIAALVMVQFFACGQRPTRLRSDLGSCESLCEYYGYCHSVADKSPVSQRECVLECRSVFSEDGEFEEESIAKLQGLVCSELLSYMDGDSGDDAL